MRGLSLVVAVVVGIGFYAGSAGADERPVREFKARMSGAQEVPAVTTALAGRTEVEFSKALDSVEVTMIITPVPTSALTASLRCGRAGINQTTAVLNLTSPAGGAPPVSFVSGTSSKLEATYTGSAITPTGVTATCPVAINNIASLLEAIRQWVIYANLQTTTSPNGELRGQIFTKY